jgi:predicted O-linked N-acetylglucosamine transferase (SPINDLY family)
LVTADFHHQHPVNIFMQPILPRLDPAQLQLTVYFTGGSYDDQTRLAQKRVAHWVECSTLSDAQLAQRIARDQIDVLVDLAGHTSLNRMAMFAQRAAPVQMSYLGYPGSTGVPHIDWLLADEVVAPKGSEALFSEKLIRLPGTLFCYHPEVDYHFPEYGQAQQTRTLTFGSFNNAPKLTPRTIALWARVLQAVPDSRLVLKAPSFKDAGAVASFQRRFASHGIDTSRLEFRGPVGLSDMMAEYADIDIALDPVPYNGGTTTLQALWMGVPVVVLAGSHFVSLMGASFMTALASSRGFKPLVMAKTSACMRPAFCSPMSLSRLAWLSARAYSTFTPYLASKPATRGRTIWSTIRSV